MKKLLFIFLIVFQIAGFLNAQEREGSSRSDTAQISNSGLKIKSEISSFKLENQFGLKVPVQVDTSTINFHIYSPMFQQGISNTHLGYLGAPFISNDFFDRINNRDYYFNTSLNAYCKSQRDVTYYNTTTPFAILMYDQGMGEEEQVFKAFFTQNIDSVTNLGFQFDAIKAKGNYKYQEANHKNLNLFFSRNTERYNAYASLITRTNRVVENGGIGDSLVNLGRSPYDLFVNLKNGIGPEIKTFSFLTSYEYLLGEIPFLKRESEGDSLFVPRYGIQYSAEITSFKRNFTETSVDTSFFNTTFFDQTSNRYDSSSFQRITQIVQLKVLENEARKFTFGKRVFLENEIVSAMHPISDGHRKYNYSNLFLGGEISNRSNNFMQWSTLVRFALLGRNLGDAIVKGTLHKPLLIFGDTLSLHSEGWYQNISPDIFQEHWQDNHFKWENKFSKQHEIVLKARVDWDKINLHSGVNYVLMSNFIYNDKDALPAQFDGGFSVLSFWLNKEFRLGPFLWNNKFIVQESTNNSLIHLPALNLYSGLSVNGVLFKVMKYQIGAEVYYNSMFYADKYEPATTRFYLQDDILTGGYPQLNAFINAKLKRTSAFVRLTHFNSSFSGGKFFSSPFYPVNQSAFQFNQIALQYGFIWSFYD
jgi:hypothetical protein